MKQSVLRQMESVSPSARSTMQHERIHLGYTAHPLALDNSLIFSGSVCKGVKSVCYFQMRHADESFIKLEKNQDTWRSLVSSILTAVRSRPFQLTCANGSILS